VRVAAGEGAAEADQLQQFGGAGDAGRAPSETLGGHGLADDAPDGLPRVDAGVGVLEDHLEAAALAAQRARPAGRSGPGPRMRPADTDRTRMMARPTSRSRTSSLARRLE
jgi:hypothetical protein